MLTQMDWLMIPFAVFYMMLAALAVVVWVQVRRGGVRMPATKETPRRHGGLAATERARSRQHS